VSELKENWRYRRLVIALTKEFWLPAIYPDRMLVELGGLMSFGVDSNRLVSRPRNQPSMD
jgi:hypothetical protein